MPNNRNTLKINILDLLRKKKKKERRPAGGYYLWHEDPANQPKKPKRQREIDRNYRFPQGKNIRDIA